MTEWPGWEDWEHGWDVLRVESSDAWELTFEGESIEHLLPPHLPIVVGSMDRNLVPSGPWNNPQTANRDFMVTWVFENGWSAVVTDEWGVALNPAIIHGINRRLLGDDWTFPLPSAFWADPARTWQEDETAAVPGFEGCGPMLEDPDHLLACLAAISVLPSHR